jgi:hypothetical protein
MENLFVPEDTCREIKPISLNAETGLCQIGKVGFNIENRAGFFEPIIKWFKQFTIEANRQITLEVDNFCQSHDLYWKYFAEILNLLEDYNSKGQVKVIWHCADIDELECAEEFSTICDKLEFVLVKSEGFH